MSLSFLFQRFTIIACCLYIAAMSVSEPLCAAEDADDGRRHGIGIAYSGSTIDFDIERGGTAADRFSGWAVFGKYGITDRWSILASVRELEDDGRLDPGEEISFRLIDAHASFTWLVTRNFVWHAKAGFAHLAFESTRSPGSTMKDSAFSPSLGGGFQWGRRKVRLIFDFGISFPQVELIPGSKESLVVGNANTGLIVRF